MPTTGWYLVVKILKTKGTESRDAWRGLANLSLVGIGESPRPNDVAYWAISWRPLPAEIRAITDQIRSASEKERSKQKSLNVDGHDMPIVRFGVMYDPFCILPPVDATKMLERDVVRADSHIRHLDHAGTEHDPGWVTYLSRMRARAQWAESTLPAPGTASALPNNGVLELKRGHLVREVLPELNEKQQALFQVICDSPRPLSAKETWELLRKRRVFVSQKTVQGWLEPWGRLWLHGVVHRGGQGYCVRDECRASPGNVAEHPPV